MRKIMKCALLLALVLALALPVFAQAAVVVEWPNGEEIAFKTEQEAKDFLKGEGPIAQEWLQMGKAVKENGQLIHYFGKVETDENGEIKMPLPFSSDRQEFQWFVKENVPQYYMLDGEVFVPVASGETTEVRNKRADYKVKKVDETGKPLKDVEFALYGYPVMYMNFSARLKKTEKYVGWIDAGQGTEFVYAELPESDRGKYLDKNAITFLVSYQYEGSTYKQFNYTYAQMEAGVDIKIENPKERLIIEEFGWQERALDNSILPSALTERRFTLDIEVNENGVTVVNVQSQDHSLYGDWMSTYAFDVFAQTQYTFENGQPMEIELVDLVPPPRWK